MLLELHRCLFNRQCSPSLWYRWQFSASNTLLIECLVLLLRQTTGHMDMPRVQQQQIQPQSNHRTLTGIVLLSTLLTRVTVALYSSGATLALSPCWNSTSNLLLRPNTVMCPTPRITTDSGVTWTCSLEARDPCSSSWRFSSKIASKFAIHSTFLEKFYVKDRKSVV